MRTFEAFVISLMLGGCAGGTPAADAPDAEAKADEKADTEASESMAESDSEASDDADKDDDGSSSESSESEPKMEAERLLTQEGTSFVYDFSKSEAGEKAKERCEKASGGNAEKNAKCMSKASKGAKQHGFKFERDKSGEGFLFVRFEIKAGKLIVKNRVKAEFADDTGKKITVKTQGPDQVRGGPPVPASFEIEVPDQYTLIIQEPGGKAVYEPKLGLFDES